MIGSLYAGISGLNTNATAMNVIGDNIANVNTTAYKSNRSSFANVLSQAAEGSGSGNVGRGVEFQGTSASWTDGTLESTGSATDLAINGNGFFIVTDSSGAPYYTRAGGFEFDNQGMLVNADGLKVQGYSINQTTGALETIGDITVAGGSSPPNATTEIGLTMNLSNDAQPVTAAALTMDSANALADVTYTAVTAGQPGNEISIRYVDPGVATGAATVSVTGDAITVTLAHDGTAITSTAADVAAAINADAAASALVSATAEGAGTGVVDALAQTNLSGGLNAGTFSNSITVYDSLGTAVTLTVNFEKTATGWDWSVNPSSGTSTSSGSITFDADGNLTLPATNPSIDITGLDSGAQDLSMEWHLADSDGGVTGYANDSSVTAQEQDGYTSGSLRSVTISEEGYVIGIYSNGQRQSLFQLALADFTSYQGLSKAGGNLYTESLASGQPLIGTPGSAQLGNISPSTLEGSNVDLSSEFVNMITTQRAFQANSRVITTSDEILQELISLKR